MNNPPTVEELTSLLPLGRGVRVVAVGADGLLALEKPAGLLSHPNSNDPHSTRATLLEAPYNLLHECYQWEPRAPDGPGMLHLLNRLDSPTSGLVLAALNLHTAAAGRDAFAQGQLRKTYFALVVGRPRPPDGQWSDRLARNPGAGPPAGRGVRVAPVSARAPGLTARTRYACVETLPGKVTDISLLRLEPLTGRTHQLRVQCATHQVPIVGDGTYGDFSFNRDFRHRAGHKRLFLHAAAMKIPSLNFAAESPLPEVFRAVLRTGADG
jgi:tRNA pseudouridine65 synthase